MRIIAGKYRNRAIQTPPGDTTRPLLTRIRKSVFDILSPHLRDACVLDCYSGTGIVAFESFSRGAMQVTSIENNKTAYEYALKNHQQICPRESYRLLRGDVLEVIPRLATMGEQFEVIGVMPPFGQELVTRTLELLDRHADQLLYLDTVIFTQHENGESVPSKWKNFELVRMKEYGRNVFLFFMPTENEPLEE